LVVEKHFWRSEMWNSLKSGVSKMANGAKNAGTGLLNKMGDAKDAMVSGVKTAGHVIGTGITGAVNVVKENAGAIGEFPKNNAGAIGTAIGTVAGSFIPGAGSAIGGAIGNRLGNWVQGGGLEKTKVGQSITGLAKSIHSGDGEWKQHLGNVATATATKLTSRVAKRYVGADNVRSVKRALRHGGPIGGPRSMALPHGPRALTYQSTTGPSHGGGPASNVYNGGGVTAKHSAPAMTSEQTARSRVQYF
jgi:hypothetical protein